MFISRLKTAATSTKGFASRHKTALTVTSTALVTTSVVLRLNASALDEAYTFIEAAGLTEKFINSVPLDQIYT